MNIKDELLRVEDLSISFLQNGTDLKHNVISVVRSLNISVAKGNILAVVGGSGSGKTLLAHAIMGILPSNASVTGSIYYKGELLTDSLIRSLRGREIAFIPQSLNYLDPLMKVGEQVRIGLPRKSAKKVQKELFLRYGLEPSSGDLFPFQLSGGMLRRVLFAMSVREGVDLIVADEPTPGIHPEALESILSELRKLADRGVGVIMITHDIMSSLRVCDYVAILRDGENVETAPASAFEGRGENLREEYSRKLWLSLPQNDFTEDSMEV